MKVRQPAYIHGNVYLNGADHFDREEDCCESHMDPEVRITEEGEEVYLEITLPQDFWGIPEMQTEIITTQKLGMVRIVEQRFESPEGKALRLDVDIRGRAREERPLPGPVEGLHAGKNRVSVFHRILPQDRKNSIVRNRLP